MARQSRENAAVRSFILKNVSQFPRAIASVTAELFGLSRASINGYLNRLIDQGLLLGAGTTKARSYSLARLVDISATIPISVGVSDDAAWQFRIAPALRDVRKNIVDLCHYGFTEMLNNAIEHSGSATAMISVRQTAVGIEMMVADEGVGIFDKIRLTFGLSDARSALLELSKGKLTSDPRRHAGEGIFFTSRMFDRFSIHSSNLVYVRRRVDDADWLIEVEDEDHYQGTAVTMSITLDAQWTTQEVFETYQGDSVRFRKTHVPLLLGKQPGEQLVSRSQAKRILARFEEFSEVLLDFQGVEEIGQPFADEIFRVFAANHPAITVRCVNASPLVEQMIAYVRKGEDYSEPRLL